MRRDINLAGTAHLKVAVEDPVILSLGGLQSSFQRSHVRLQVVHTPRLALVPAKHLRRSTSEWILHLIYANTATFRSSGRKCKLQELTHCRAA